MIDALVTGRLVSCHEEENLVKGRIVIDGDKPVQFFARRAAVKTAMLELPLGMPVAVSGRLNVWVKHDKELRPFVHHEIVISAVLTAQPKGLLASLF